MAIETKLFKFCMWLLAACILAGMVTGCNPYMVAETSPALASMVEGLQTSASPAAPVYSNTEQTTTPAPYWQLAQIRPARTLINPADYSGRIGY